jgi:hypothetical protein
VTTHGWIPAGADPEKYVDWIVKMDADMRVKLDSSWEVAFSDWSNKAQSDVLGVPGVLANAKEQGKLLAKSILDGDGGAEWKHVHLIGHSAGSYVISTAASMLVKARDAGTFKGDIHLTFLDAAAVAPGIEFTLGSSLDRSRDWSDSYFVGPPADLTPFTSEALWNSHNVILTAIALTDPSYAVPPGLFPYHGYPIHWYGNTINDPTGAYGAVQGNRTYGFARSLEEGGWNDRGDYPVGNLFPVVLMPKKLGDKMWATSEYVTSSTGTVLADDLGVVLGTGSPVWATMMLDIPLDANYISFTYGFEGNGSGYLTVYLNDQLLLIGDQRVDGQDIIGSGILPIESLVKDVNWLSFRLDPIGADPADVRISNVEFGVVPEPASMTLLTIGTMCLLARRRRAA